MPTYDVIKPGFYAGKLYSPEGKRRVLVVDAPFKKTPSWLKPRKDIVKTEDEKKADVAAAKKAKAKAAQDKRDIDAAVNFQEPVKLSGPVETL